VPVLAACQAELLRFVGIAFPFRYLLTFKFSFIYTWGTPVLNAKKSTQKKYQLAGAENLPQFWGYYTVKTRQADVQYYTLFSNHSTTS
jgi:hypothetical protein